MCRKHPNEAEIFKTIFHINQSSWNKMGTKGKHQRQASPSLISSSFLWHECYFHLGMLWSHLLCLPTLFFQDPWAVLGSAFAKGFLFIDFLSKLILIANTWGLFSRSPLSAAAGSVTPCHIFSTQEVWAIFQGYWNKNWRIPFKVPRR